MEEQPPAARKPVPTDFKRWDREVRGVVKFLYNVPEFNHEFGNKWAHKTMAYHLARLEHLLSNPPRVPKTYILPNFKALSNSVKQYLSRNPIE